MYLTNIEKRMFIEENSRSLPHPRILYFTPTDSVDEFSLQRRKSGTLRKAEGAK
jgi:hypothetical protein